MEHEGKEKKVYHGIWIPFLFIVLVPVICFLIFFFVLTNVTDHPQDIVIKISLGFSGIIGVLFALICLISGFIHDVFLAFVDRVKEVFEFFTPFTKEATRWYFYRFKEDGGIIFWIYFLLLISFLAVGIYGFVAFFTWYKG